jgi:polygalacturonase
MGLQRRLKRIKKSSQGSTHVILILLVIVGAGIIGTYMLVMSHADDLSSLTYGPGTVIPSGTVFNPATYRTVTNDTNGGTTDDSVAIQDAINAANAKGGGTVLLQGITYYCEHALKIPSNITLTGLNTRSTLVFPWLTESVDKMSSSYIVNTSQNETNITLSNFTVMGGDTIANNKLDVGNQNPQNGLPAGSSRAAVANNGSSLASAIRIEVAKNININHLEIADSPANGISLWGVINSTVTNNDIHNSGRGGIVYFWTNMQTNKNMTITNNLINYLGDDGIAINGTDGGSDNTTGALPTNITITNNRIRSWALSEMTGWPAAERNAIQGRGIALLGVTQANVTNNTIHNIAESGILIRGSDIPGQCNGSSAWYSSNVTVTGNNIASIGENDPTNGRTDGKFWRTYGIEIDHASQTLYAQTKSQSASEIANIDQEDDSQKGIKVSHNSYNETCPTPPPEQRNDD